MKTTIHILSFGILLTIFACTGNSQPSQAQNSPKDDGYIGTWEDEMQGGYKYQLSEAEWKQRLSDDAFYILRKAGTERPNSSPLNKVSEPGVFYSAATGQPLFTTDTKFKSGTGWPSFYKPISEDAVVLKEDNSLGMSRVEVLDSSSGSHLGHVFKDGPRPTGLRYCLNGDALIFVAKGEEPPAIVKEYLEKHPEEKPEI
jgi:methionine-R-sulfoxide reductase